MRYAVRWSRRALETVAQVWLDNPSNRAVITAAVATADELLAVDPSNQGESREEDHRVVFVQPLVLTISVDTVGCVVRVLNIRHLDRRKPG